MPDKPEDKADWRLATWEGASRETLRRWAELPLERVIAALEEMQELGDEFHSSDTVGAVQESNDDYDAGTEK